MWPWYILEDLGGRKTHLFWKNWTQIDTCLMFVKVTLYPLHLSPLILSIETKNIKCRKDNIFWLYHEYIRSPLCHCIRQKFFYMFSMYSCGSKQQENALILQKRRWKLGYKVWIWWYKGTRKQQKKCDFGPKFCKISAFSCHLDH